MAYASATYTARNEIMHSSEWRQRFVYCKNAYLSVYQFTAQDSKLGPTAIADREVVILIAGCANTVAIYSMLGDRSLPNYLDRNGYEVWAMDCRGEEHHLMFTIIHISTLTPPNYRTWRQSCP